MRILVIDDDPITREMLQQTLSGHGYEVHTAADGAEGLRKLQAEAIRLVISDWEMPQMSGLELCQAIREQEGGPYVYVVLLTSREGVDAAVEGLSAGADDFICKPFSPAELVMRIRVGERILSLESRDITIFALAKLAESRDPDTGAHLDRVRNYARVLALHLSTVPQFQDVVDGEYVRLIYETSPLHDIGKVAIPDCVLLKPGRLTDREFEIMKTHTIEGARTLEAALSKYPDARFLQIARDIARSHHERWDGSGYPDGLAAEQIPLCARIVTLADVYDALVTRRVYKGSFCHDVARSIIMQESGSHFDPQLVQAFLATEARFARILDQYTEPRAQAMTA